MNQPRMFQVRYAHGFTLIELLVVIAIVSLLISILLPALSRARDSVRLTQCSVNARTVAMASFAYAADNKNYAPDHQFGTDLVAGNYMANNRSLYCPVNASSASNWLGLRTPGPGWHYAGNIMMYGSGGNTPWFPGFAISAPSGMPAKLDNVLKPYLAMFYSDSSWRGPTYTHWNDYTDMIMYGRTDAAWANPPHPRPADASGVITFDTMNVAYQDGHGGNIKYKGDANIAALRANRDYPFNFKTYWGWNAYYASHPSTSDGGWDRAPFAN